MRKIIITLLTVALILSVGGQALALDNGYVITGDIGVQWTNTSSMDISLDFDGSKAICGAYIIGKIGVDKITGTVTLSRKNSDGTYTTVKTWSNITVYDDLWTFDAIYYVSTGYRYRLTVTATVYKNGYGEVVSGYHEANA